MNYESILRNVDLKVTPQRLGVLSIMETFGHISIEELFPLIRKEFSSISLATLYKNINAMLEAKILHEVSLPHAKPKYELIKEEHSHMLCQKCGKLEDITINLDAIKHEASALSGYKLAHNDVMFSGICPECQTKP